MNSIHAYVTFAHNLFLDITDAPQEQTNNTIGLNLEIEDQISDIASEPELIEMINCI